MSKVKSLFAVAIALSTAVSAANAAVFTQTVGNVTLTVTSVGTPHDDFGDTANGYTGYLVHLDTTDGSKITSLTFLGTGAALETGFTGPMLQQWTYSTTKKGKVFSSTPNVAATDGGLNGGDFGTDSHFLFANFAADIANSAPSEDNLLESPPGAPADDGSDTWGTGASLTTSVGLGTANQTASLDTAYLVIPNTGKVTYDFAVFTTTPINNGNGAQFDGAIPGVASPEPASLGLLGLGLVGLLAKRRKA